MVAIKGIEISWVEGNCPVQAEGTFDRIPFYFRARGTRVTVDVGNSWTWTGPEYEWPDAGWILEETARAFISEAYAAWKNREGYDLILRRNRRENAAREEAGHAIRFANILEDEMGKEAAKPAVDALTNYAVRVLNRVKPER